MNFFQHQDDARKSTRKLVVFFVLAIISLIALTNLVILLSMGFLQRGADGEFSFDALNWEIFGIVSVAVVGVILVGSLYKIISLSSGGASVAEMLDAKLVGHEDHDFKTRRLLNVVEEMAIASGTPVPPVYIMEEDSINAFAAGFSPGDAVIGITRGAIEKLSRDELQGVIAHEFSHILNGDMRMNIRLIGILHGILVIGMIGYMILRSGARSSGSKKDGGGIVILGLGLLIVGYAGTFFGNLIKSAVSRQREFLADASAVQYTRNPDGIADALKRIGGDAYGSELENPNASENSHAYFAQGIGSFFEGLFATHPPLEQRIKSIQPQWDGTYIHEEANAQYVDPESTVESEPERDKKSVLLGAMTAAQAANIVEQAGTPEARHVEYAKQIIADIPEIFRNAAHEPYSARALIYLMVLDSGENIRQKQLDHLANKADTGVYDETVRLFSEAQNIKTEHRLVLIEMCLPALRQLSAKQYELFKTNLVALIKMDAKINLFEWSLQKIIFHHLDEAFGKKFVIKDKLTTLKNNTSHIEILLSALIHIDNDQTDSPQNIISSCSEILDKLPLNIIDKKDINLNRLNQSIEALATLKPLQKPKLLKACAQCITSNQKVTAVEAELFRAISDAMNCPMPPLLSTE